MIKFRAWHKSWKEFGKVGKISFDDEEDVYTVLFKGKFIFENLQKNEVILMQSTGLKDKKAQEIFEGDVIKRDGIKRPEVVRFGQWVGVDSLGYKEQYIGFYFESEHEGQEWLHSVEPQFNHLYKVIGNIYENPELLEVE
jgi:uncharacterized phage protein (TIGR01671 family)